jgi:hypothetical protein
MKTLTIPTICIITMVSQGLAQQATDLKPTLPDTGKLSDGKPAGEGWLSMIDTLDDWNAEPEYWKLEGGILKGASTGGKHHHAYTKMSYTDFELHVVIKMRGKGANSGVCIRLNATNPDNAPGYQVDMGPGYWGCLWEERRSGMVQKFPKELANKLVKANDWNHYYIIAKGHHIQAWLNGVKTIDVVHDEGFAEGAIGFQLCHGKKETIVDVKTLLIKE